MASIDETIRELKKIKRELAKDIQENNPEMDSKEALKMAGRVHTYTRVPYNDYFGGGPTRVTEADLAIEKGYVGGDGWRQRIVKISIDS